MNKHFPYTIDKLFHMAMLAEPRFKRKISINPNGKDWSNDETKFGKKLMKKYGWTEGKGLGVNEDGNPDHVKVQFKFGSKGVGYKHNHSDNWIAHQDDFNSILANLNEGTAEQQASVSCIESASKKSRSRVHYQRFVQGKDLSKRSTSDLDSIFGVRKVSKRKKEGEKVDMCTEKSLEEPASLVTFTSSDSLQEYFAKKMAAKKNNNPQCQNNVETSNEQDWIQTEATSEKKRQKKKRKAKLEEDEERKLEESEDERVTFSLGDEAEECEVKIKKRKKNKDLEPVELGDAYDNSSHCDNEVESAKKSKKSKKKRKEEKGSVEEEVLEENVESNDSECVKEGKKEKGKKKEKQKHGKETERKKNAPADKSEDFNVEVKKSKKKKSKQGELENNGTTDGRARRVVFDSEGNFDRVDEIQQSTVCISKESYMKTFMPNYTEKVKAGINEKRPLKSKTAKKTLRSKNAKKSSSGKSSVKLSVDKPRTFKSHSGAVRGDKNETPSTFKSYLDTEGGDWNEKHRTSRSHSSTMGRDWNEKSRIFRSHSSTLERDRNETPRTFRSHSGTVRGDKNKTPRTSRSHSGTVGGDWNKKAASVKILEKSPRAHNHSISFNKRQSQCKSYSLRSERKTVLMKPTFVSREEKRRILEQDIKTKLPSIEDVFKVKGASVHAISGVYEKPVKSEKLEGKNKTVKAKKLSGAAKKGGKTISVQKSGKDSNKDSLKKKTKKTSNKPKGLSDVEKRKIELIRETTGIIKTRHQLKKSLWYAKQRFKK